MVTVGKVGGLYGARGEVSLVLYDAFPADIDIEEPVFVGIDGHRVPLFFATFVRRGRRGATATFDDIDNEFRAAELVGREIFARDTKYEMRDTNYEFASQSNLSSRTLAEGSAPEMGGSAGSSPPVEGWQSQTDGVVGSDGEDFVGWTAELGGGRTGEVVGFLDGANPLFEILITNYELRITNNLEKQNASILIPAQTQFIAALDKKSRTLTLDLPDGLLDLNS